MFSSSQTSTVRYFSRYILARIVLKIVHATTKLSQLPSTFHFELNCNFIILRKKCL